jgi:hypothetical protein
MLSAALGMPVCACAQAPPPQSAPSPAAAAPDAARRASAAARDETPSPQLLEAVRADAARTLVVAAESIEFIAIEPVVWPDGGLGCARPDEMVTMAQVPGFRLQLRARGGTRLLEYHTNRRSHFRRCPTASLRPPPPPAIPDR